MRGIVDSYFTRMDSLEPISSKELLSRIRDHAVLLLDVRPEDEFAAGHLPTAQNITIETLEARLSDLPTDREIVAYCRGPYCVLSFKAVEALRTRGFKVRRLTDGYPEWKAAVLPVEA